MPNEMVSEVSEAIGIPTGDLKFIEMNLDEIKTK